MARLDRVVDAVEAIVHQHLAEQAEMHVDRRVNVIGQQQQHETDGNRRFRTVDLNEAQRNRNKHDAEPHLHRVADVVRRVQFGRRMVHHVDRPEQDVLGPVPPIDEEIGQHRQHQELQRVTGGAERRQPCPQWNGDDLADGQRSPEIADRPREHHAERSLDEVHRQARQACAQRVALDHADVLDDGAKDDDKRRNQSARSKADQQLQGATPPIR